MAETGTWKSPEEVAALYNSPFTAWYQTISDSYCHFGYWPEPDSGGSLVDAVHRLNALHLESIRVGPGQRYLDVGCGLGRMAVRVAQEKGCEVDGVTISELHFEGSRKFAAEHGLSDRVRFHVADAGSMPFPDGTFDGACFIESLLHIGYRRGLREVSRVLKKGGEILLSDFPALRPLTAEETTFYREAWCANDIVTMDEHKQIFEEAGLALVRARDLTKHTIIPGFRAWQDALLHRKDEIVAACGPELAEEFSQVMPKMREQAGSTLGYCVYELRKR